MTRQTTPSRVFKALSTALNQAPAAGLAARARLAWLCWGLAFAAPAALAQAPGGAAAPAASAATADDKVEAKIAPLLGMALSQVGGLAFESAVGEAPSDFFRRLWQRWTGPAVKGQGPSAAAVSALAASQAARSGSSEARLVPAIGYSLEQLDPATFSPVRQLKLGDKPPVLKTGDVFVLRYAASLPGQVRLENMDSAGQLGDLGTYTVLPDQTNRLPHDRGIRLDGAPGTEMIRLYFYPCMPAEAERQPWAAAFKGQLSSCGKGLAAPIAAASRGTLRAKALTSLAQPDPTMAFSGSDDYNRDDVVSTVVVLTHEGR